MLLCDNKPNGEVVPFVRIFSDDCVTDLTVNGAPYAVMGAVAPCTEDQADGCDTTTPVTTAHLCLEDGTPIAVVMQRDCDGVVSAPGWVNLISGVYTAGLVPADAAPCDSSVATAGTANRIVLCDVQSDGSVVGFLRAIDGDGTITDTTIAGFPYVPVGTVGVCDAITPIAATALTLADGTPITVVSQRDRNGVTSQTGWINATTGVFTAGAPPATTRAGGDAEPDLAILCDTAANGTVTSFVRNYERNRAGDVVGFTDHTLAGAPYAPTGTVGTCGAVPPCASPTTPLSTTGLCLADGTPIATVATRDCDGVVTQTGWLNLATGVYTTGLPPAGTTACGSSESIQLSGVLCDVDPATGDVFALVLVEYHYDDTGAIESVRLVRASDGTTYVLQGNLTVCPGNEPCRNCETTELADSTATPLSLNTVRDTVWSPRYLTAADFGDPAVVAQRLNVPAGGTGFWGGDTTVFPNDPADPDGGDAGVHYGIAGVVSAVEQCAACLSPDDLVTITASGSATNDGPGGGLLTDGRWRILRDGGEADGAVPQLFQVDDVDRPAGTTWDFTATAIVPWGDVLAGRIVLTLDLETRSNGQYKQWTASAFEVSAEPVTPAAGCGTRFLRVVCRDCDGVVVSVSDTTNGIDAYIPVGGVAAPVECGAPCCLPIQPICYAESSAGTTCDDGVQQDLPVTQPVIGSATVEQNPNGFVVNGLAATHDGLLTTWCTIAGDANGALPGMVIRYTFVNPTDIAIITLYNQFGSIHDDQDGIGTATLTVYDDANTVLWTGPLNAGNGGAPFVTTFGEVLEGAASFTLSDIARQATSTVTTIGWREISASGLYRTLIVWDCPNETITAEVVGTQAGITYDGDTITQTNGPHTFTFGSSAGAFTLALQTDNPAAWSVLEVSDTAPTTELSQSASLALGIISSDAITLRAGLLAPDGTVTDATTGAVIQNPTIVPCVAPREADHPTVGDILPMCEDGHPFLRHVNLTRDGDTLVTDTEIDGRTPYAPINPAAVQAGTCQRDRLGEVCAELGPLLTPSAMTGFTQNADCLTTTAADPTVTYTGTITSIEFSEDAGVAGGAGFVFMVNGNSVTAFDFTPLAPAFPIVTSEYSATATVAGITITAELVEGALGRSNTAFHAFGLAGRMRFTFSPDVNTVQIQTVVWGNTPANQICDVVVLPSPAPDPQQLVAFRSGDGTVTYYQLDGTEVELAVLLPCGSCCTGGPGTPTARGVRVTDASGPWTPGDVTGELISLTATVITGDGVVIDAVGSQMSFLPAGVALTWATGDGQPIANPPQSINVGPGGVVAVTWVQR